MTESKRAKEQRSQRAKESKSKGAKEQRRQRAKESESKGVKEHAFERAKKLYKVHAYLSCKRLKVDKSNKNFFAIHDDYFGGIALTMVYVIKLFTAVIYEFS